MTARFGLKRYFSRGVTAACLLAAIAIAGTMISSGCGDVTTATDTGGNTNPTNPPAGGSNEPIDLSKVTWVHGKNIGDFPVTASLGKVTFEKGVMVCSDGMSWPSNWTPYGGSVNANHVVLAQINGQWYGGAWEAMRAGIQRCREMETIAHKQTAIYGPFGQVEQDPFWTWRPKKGEKIGFMVTSWIRSGQKQPTGRSHVVMTTWPY